MDREFRKDTARLFVHARPWRDLRSLRSAEPLELAAADTSLAPELANLVRTSCQ